jgi:hypothetical protein
MVLLPSQGDSALHLLPGPQGWQEPRGLRPLTCANEAAWWRMKRSVLCQPLVLMSRVKSSESSMLWADMRM